MKKDTRKDTDNRYTGFALAAMYTALAERQVTDQILQCNKATEKYGLILTEHQALSLAQTRTTSLKENRRIEFGTGIVDKLIMEFCDSPYLSQENYEDTLHELISLFYELKNLTEDRVSDRDLMEFMKQTFAHVCHGSLELLSGEAMRLSEHIHCGGTMKTFRPKEI